MTEQTSTRKSNVKLQINIENHHNFARKTAFGD